jgi:RNA polymerase sigma factor (sigma-70 family)
MTTLARAVRHIRRLAEVHLLQEATDRHLLERFTRSRDEGAFAELVRRHGPMVLAACRRVLRQEQDAEDVFQAAFLVLARKAGSIHDGASVGGWLYQVARRQALRLRAARDRRRRLVTPLGDVADPSPAGPTRDPLRASLDEELERLPAEYRSAVVLCYLEGRSQAEAARLLATTQHAVNSRLKRARDLLRERLAREGLALSGVALATAAAPAALPAALVHGTARAACTFVAGRASACGASALAVNLAKGAMHGMITPKAKGLAALACLAALLTTGALLLAPALGSDPDAAAAPAREPRPGPATAGAKGKVPRSCILLWMSGGPSQLDTFDLKGGDVGFDARRTSVKGMKISEHLPRLAKLANHLAIIRSLTHVEGDHGRAAYLMRTGRSPVGAADYPSLPCVLGKELGKDRPDLPRYVSIGPMPRAFTPTGFGPGFLGPQFGPLAVGVRTRFDGDEAATDEKLRLPPAGAFTALAGERGSQMRKAVEKAFDLGEEKPAVRAAYGKGLFGQGCLLARRLVERGVPVVEVTLPGWDTHANNFPLVQKLSGDLDAGMAALLKDLRDRKRLDSTLVVWMGEFGRTPRVNGSGGRDHWPRCFSVVLAGCGIKGGQVIGKTSADGTDIEQRPVTPPELLATIYQALGIDPATEYRTSAGAREPLVKPGNRPVREALR